MRKNHNSSTVFILRSLAILVSLFVGLLASARTIPGFSYQISCRQALSGVTSPIEVVHKMLEGTTWPEGSKENFSFMEFNVLNMIDHEDAMKMDDGAKFVASGYKYYAKPLAQLQGVSRVFNKYRPMLAFCVEIGSVKVMKDYDQEFLGNQYEEFLIEGNDPRGVDVGLMLRKDLPLEVEVHSHKNLTNDESGNLVFSRDLPAYILREKGTAKPLMIIFGTHFKSQRSSNGDSRGFKKRSLQAKAASLIIEDYEKEFPGVPIILTGDFNNDIRRAPEFEPLKQMGMVDSFDLAKDTVEKNRRGTHFFFPREGNPSISQLDAILLNQVAAQKQMVKEAKVLSHIDPEGNAYPPPQSYQERETRASDHLPIMSIFDLSL